VDIFATVSSAWQTTAALLGSLSDADWLAIALKFFPFVLLFELPIQAVVMLGALRHYMTQRSQGTQSAPCPPVSCVITCYSEGEDVALTIRSLTEQLYDGSIEMLAIVDGAQQNRATLDALLKLEHYVNARPKRRLVVVPKTQRGGRVSSLNQGLALARGEIVMALDGDTSFDTDMVRNITRRFADPRVAAVSGNLRVRNADKSLTTRLQALEYMLSIHLSRTGLSHFNIVNNVSGAFGAFRRDLLERIGGWDSGTAEDLDITLRIKKYFARYPHLKIVFAPDAIGHTDAPVTFGGFLHQRLRWDGDLYYLYVRKHWQGFRPGLLGWRNFLALVWAGLTLQLVLPFMVLIYMSYVFFVHPAGYVLGVLAFVYLFYLAMTLAMFVQYWLLLSERRRSDAQYLWVVPLFPAFAFATRVWCAVATLTEVFTKQHLDSAMAPWWVLRRTKF
jgi:poly-beta-1,6-N-acetyl-D-glucosamine synthase